MTFDELRARNPDLRFCVYALEPNGGAVSLEVIDAEDRMYRFDGPSLDAAIAIAFPDAAVAPAAPLATDDIFE